MNAAKGLVIEADTGKFDIVENAFDDVANTVDSHIVVPQLLPKRHFVKIY